HREIIAACCGCAVVGWCVGNDDDTMPPRGGGMARRRKNLLEDIIELITQLPWWTGVIAALLSWLVLYGLLHMPPPFSFPSDVVILPMLRGLATGLQYLLPAVFLAGAVSSAWRRYRQHKNYADVAGE